MINSWKSRFVERVFTPSEVAYCTKQATPSIHFAGRFAAKEAARKALSAAGRKRVIPFLDIDVRRNENGVPSLDIPGTQGYNLALSISHTETLATATVVVETDG